jgi:hypothetical protein
VELAVGKRRQLVHQAALVWSDRGAPAIERYIQTGSFGDGGQGAEPYNQDTVKAIVSSGRLV